MEQIVKAPFITIGVSSYNYSRYLWRGFKAIQKQTFNDYEIIYVDDGSTDDSVEVIKTIIAENPRIKIRLIENAPNKGIVYTKNLLIKEATGTYLMLCDSDDWMSENCLEKLAEAALVTDADRVVSEVADVYEDGRIAQVQKIARNPSPWLWNLHHGCLYKRSILLDNNISIKGVPDDVYLTTEFNQYAKSTVWIRQVLYYWQIHDDSAGRKAEYNIDSIVLLIEKIIRYLNEISRKMGGKGKNVKEILGVLFLKIYYLYLFNDTRYFTLKDKLICYKLMRHTAEKSNLYVLNNRLLKTEYTSGLRHYAYMIIHYSALLERVHLMPLALCGYHVLSKIHYFDQ